MGLSFVKPSRAISLVILLLFGVAGIVPQAASASPARQGVDEPEISARAAIVVEYPSGRILYAKSPHDRLAPASTTKILTAILALEYGNLDDLITVEAEDLVGESSMGLLSGEQQTLHDLLYGLMLPSGNDAAMTIARALGANTVTANPTLTDPVDRFIEMMNVRVAQLGLTNSHFANPHGLDAYNHYSSAYDLASLSWYAMHIPVFNDIVRQVAHDSPDHPMFNTNEMLTRYPGADGIKTGWTDEGGLCLVTSATRDGHRLISVVLNAPQWYSDSAVLLDYGFAQLADVSKHASAEVLSVSERGTVSWLLVNSAPAPPMPAVAQPGQGGGLTLPLEGEQVAVSAAPDEVLESAAPQPQVPSFMGGSDASATNSLWVGSIIALLGGVCSLMVARLWGFRPAMLLSGLRLTSSQRLSASPTGRSTPMPPRSRPAVVRTLGESPSGRRREPSLLQIPGEDPDRHVSRAVALAWEGRQGSSMSEFLLALRLDNGIEAAEVAESYQMNAQAFLALARAQMAMGRALDARHTLLHAVLVLPDERVLKLALHQLRSSE